MQTDGTAFAVVDEPAFRIAGEAAAFNSTTDCTCGLCRWVRRKTQNPLPL